MSYIAPYIILCSVDYSHVFYIDCHSSTTKCDDPFAIEFTYHSSDSSSQPVAVDRCCTNGQGSWYDRITDTCTACEKTGMYI